MHLRVRALEREWQTAVGTSPPSLWSPSPDPGARDSLDFIAFKHIASTLHWPKRLWPLLLQCKFVGKAQEICTALSIVDSLDYDIEK